MGIQLQVSSYEKFKLIPVAGQSHDHAPITGQIGAENQLLSRILL